MKIVLRDDDTCFYTTPEELEMAFGDLHNVPISISVVPYAAFEHMGTYPYSGATAVEGYPDIADNVSLVEYLREKCYQGRFEIMMHALHHEYRKTATQGWITEMRCLSYEQMRKLINQGREHLESVFGSKITTFIGPSNDIPADCAYVLDQLGLHTNYMVFKKFNRKVSLYNIANYLRCNIFYAVTRKRYTGVLRYKNHQEICSYPFEGYEQMRKIYQRCKESNTPLVIYTHYWSLNKNQTEKQEYIKFIEWALNDGAEFIKMGQLWM